jgi:hypothetical protein
MREAKRPKSRVTPPKRTTAATVNRAPVAAPLKPLPKIGVVDLKIAMRPHVPAPSAAHWQSFAASIARVNCRGSLAPTVWVDSDLRGATLRIAGWDTATAVQMVSLHAANSPSPQLWQSQYYEVTVIHSEADE